MSVVRILSSFASGVPLLLTVVIACACGAARAAPPAPAAVKTIEISGTRIVEADFIRSTLTFKPGEPASPAAMDQSIKRLFATGFFSDVRIDDAGGGLVKVVVVENPRVGAIGFDGNKAIETSKLTAAITLKRGEIYTRTRAHNDEAKIRELYRKEGRYQAAVTTVTANNAAGGVDLTFKVTEGEIQKIEAIEFSGNRAFPASKLRDAISTTQSGWLDFIKGLPTHSKEQLELDRALLRQFYRKNGYPDAAVSEAKVEVIPATAGYRISFAVDEGERFSFGAQGIGGQIEGIDQAATAEKISTKADDIFDASKVETAVTAISLELANAGHPFLRVVPRQVRDNARKRIAITYTLENGPKRYISRIEITGNSRTRDYVIRRELKLTEGDAYNEALLEASRKRLMRTGFFKSAELQPVRTADAERVNLRVAVVEQDTGDLAFGVGYSQNDGIIGDASYSERNIMGTGIAGKVKVEIGQRRWGGEVGLTDPHFLGSNVAAGFDLFYRDTDRTLQSSYKEQRWGGSVKVGIPITDTITGGLNYTFTRSTLYDVGENASTAIKEAVPGYPKSTTSTYDTSSVGYSLAYDTRDNGRMPTSGLYSVVKQDFAGLGGDAAFVRSTVDTRGYYPVGNGIVLSGHLGGGYIGGYAGQDVRLLDLFYRGGETVRGFATGGIGPRDSSSVNQDALGGRAFYLASLEARAPLPGVPTEMGLSAVGFVDSGSLFSANKTASALPGLTGNSAAPRVSTGVGLVWDSPLGPLQATYGFVLSKQAGDKTQPFNFGTASGF